MANKNIKIKLTEGNRALRNHWGVFSLWIFSIHVSHLGPLP